MGVKVVPNSEWWTCEECGSLSATEKAARTCCELKDDDAINSPGHYTEGGMETIEVLQAKLTPEEFRGYLKGNVIKYVTRERHKGQSAKDLGKLAWYAKRLAEHFGDD